MAPPNPKYVDSRFDRLTEENDGLKKEISDLKESVAFLKTELQELQQVVSVNIEKGEVAETNMVSVESQCSALESNLSSVKYMCSSMTQDQGKLKADIEAQSQYSRISTLLFSGKAIPPYIPGENTKNGILELIGEYLGIIIAPVAIAACHRLKNRSIILLRFLNLEERDAVYKMRVNPIKQGLSIQESLTPERLAVVKILRSLHYPKDQSPLLTHYTDRGRIFFKPKGRPRGSGAIEVGVDATKEDILSLCEAEGPGMSRSRVRVVPPSGGLPSSRPPHRAPPGGRSHGQHHPSGVGPGTSAGASHPEVRVLPGYPRGGAPHAHRGGAPGTITPAPSDDHSQQGGAPSANPGNGGITGTGTSDDRSLRDGILSTNPGDVVTAETVASAGGTGALPVGGPSAGPGLGSSSSGSSPATSTSTTLTSPGNTSNQNASDRDSGDGGPVGADLAGSSGPDVSPGTPRGPGQPELPNFDPGLPPPSPAGMLGPHKRCESSSTVEESGIPVAPSQGRSRSGRLLNPPPHKFS